MSIALSTLKNFLRNKDDFINQRQNYCRGQNEAKKISFSDIFIYLFSKLLSVQINIIILRER